MHRRSRDGTLPALATPAMRTSAAAARERGITRRTTLLLVAGVVSLLPSAIASAADAYDPEQPGKEHSIVKGKNIQPTEPHVRKRQQRKREQERRKARKQSAPPAKGE